MSTGTIPGAPGLEAPVAGEVTKAVRPMVGPAVVAVRAWVPAGGRDQDIPGQALITGRALTEGTRRRDWQTIADDAEGRGAVVVGSASFEVLGVTVDALAGDWELALDWAAEMLLEPTLPEPRVDWLRRTTLAELDSLADLPEVRTAWAFLDRLYRPHPRSLPLQGTRESLESLDAAACREFHRGALGRGACVTVAGAVDEDTVRAAIERRFAATLAEAARDAPALATPPEPAETGEIVGETHRVELPPGDQAHLYVGCRTVPRAHPDRVALELLGVVLGAGAGLSGRLPDRVREREGLAYSVQVSTVAGSGIDPGRFVVAVGTAPETVARAEEAVRSEIERLLEEGIDDDELASARSYLVGREPFHRETPRQWADLLGEAILYGVPADDPDARLEELRSVDRQQLEAVARRHLGLDGLITVIGLPR